MSLLQQIYRQLAAAEGPAGDRARLLGRKVGGSLLDGIMEKISGGNAQGMVQRELSRAFGGSALMGAFSLAGVASRSASELGVYRRQLAYIANDTAKAESALTRFKRIAAESNFNTSEVLQMGVKIAGDTGNVDEATTKTQRLIDAAARLGVTNQNFDRFQINLSDFAKKGDNKVDRRDMEQLRKYAPTLNTSIGRTLGISAEAAGQLLGKASGNEMLKYIENIGIQNAGAAKKEAFSDPQSTSKNTLDNLKTGLDPTGRLINNALMPVAMSFSFIADKAVALNNATGGQAGLGVALGLGAIGMRTLGQKTTLAIERVGALAFALDRLASSASTAAGRTALTNATQTLLPPTIAPTIAPSAAAGKSGMMQNLATRFPALFGKVAPIAQRFAPLAAKGAGVAAKVAPYAAKASKLATPVGIGLFLAEMGFSAYAGGMNENDPRKRRFMSVSNEASDWGLKAGLVGAVIGLLGGPAGALAGYGIGSSIGGIGGGIYGATKKLDPITASQNTTDKSAETMKDAAKTFAAGVNQFQAIGGGSRVQSALVTLESAYSLQGAF